ncbi:hypothetical protein Goari_017038 [Gossypium aridum]|uniref:Uncharacterized protein n=1 Tax=Gossypium aridum TaxID=34290 RepID=A0A7J8WKI6_GOSAI|nr:hypothetical protein [Gossypium aridum]
MLSNLFFSLNDIAYAYCEVDRNSYLASLILCEMRGIPHLVSTNQSNSKVKNDETSRSSYVKSSKKYSQACDVFTVDQPVSAAIDESSANGKKYEPMESSCCNSFQRSCQTNEDLRSPKQKARLVSRDSKEMLISLSWGEEFKSSSRNEDHMYKDIEDFLFKMLGEEFRLERDAIQEVLSKPSYEIIYHC